MKKVIVSLLMVLLVSVFAFGQKNNSVEVLYFKANLACCKARACNALQSDVDSVIIKYLAEKNIQFRVIMMADTTNKELIKKYKAKSQTVILVKTKRKKETTIDLTQIVASYKKHKDKTRFEEEMKAEMKKLLK